MKTINSANLVKATLPYHSDEFSIQYASFVGREGLDEYHLMIQPKRAGDFEPQLERLSEAYAYALSLSLIHI